MLQLFHICITALNLHKRPYSCSRCLEKTDSEVKWLVQAQKTNQDATQIKTALSNSLLPKASATSSLVSEESMKGTKYILYRCNSYVFIAHKINVYNFHDSIH